MQKRILIFNVNWLGDVVFSTATIRNIRRNFPDSYLACIVPSRCYPVIKNNPHLNEVIIFDEKDRHKGLLAKLNFIHYLKGRRFDTVFLLHRSFSRALMCWMAGIPQRVGYYTPKRGFLLTQKIMPVCRDSLHRIDYYLNIIEKAGLRVEDRFSEFFIKDEDEDFIEGFLADKGIAPGDFLIGLNPGGNWMPKRWPKEYWARLADMLIGRLHAKVIVTGALTDAGLAREIQELMEGKAILACGLFNLKQFATLTKILDLFISADSGPLHIANAVGCKNIIALYGPTSTRVTAPYPLKNVVILRRDSGCITPCYKVDCPDNRCMKAITPEEVFKEAEKIRGER